MKQNISKTQIRKLTIPVDKNKFQHHELHEYNYNTWNSDLCKEVKCSNYNNIFY